MNPLFAVTTPDVAPGDLAAWLVCLGIVIWIANEGIKLKGKLFGPTGGGYVSLAKFEELRSQLATVEQMEDVRTQLNEYSSAHYKSRQDLHGKVNNLAREVSRLSGIVEGVGRQFGIACPPPISPPETEPGS